MNALKLTTLALALAAAFPTQAQTTPDTTKELQAVKDRLAEVEKKLKAAETAAAAAKTDVGGADQAKELNRVAVKTEAMEDARDAAGFKGLKVSGYVDPVYLHNYDQNAAGFHFVVPINKEFYGYSASYFGSAMIDFQKEMDGGTKWRLTLMPARSTSDVFGDASIVHEASVVIPLGDQRTRLIVGQLPDWSGYEYLPATQNKLITHNLLFDYTLPIAYTGAGLDLLRGKWAMKAVIANLNVSHRTPNEVTPAVAYRVDYSGGEFWGLGLAGVNGVTHNFRAFDPDTGEVASNPVTGETYSTKNTWVDLVELDGYYTRGNVTLQGQASYGHQKDASVTADPVTGKLRNAEWMGASVLGAYKFTPRLEGVLRADYLYNQKNGGGLLTYAFADGGNAIGPSQLLDGDPEKGANRFAVSAGFGYAFNANTVFHFEYRYDAATQAAFAKAKGDTFVKDNHLLATSVVVSF